MLAMAFLAITPPSRTNTTPQNEGLIPMTLNEVRRVLDACVIGATATIEHALKWAQRRRKH